MNSPHSPKISLPPLNIPTKKQSPQSQEPDHKRRNSQTNISLHSPKQAANFSPIQNASLQKMDFCLSPFISSSLKDVENNSVIEKGRLLKPMLDNKFFRINEKGNFQEKAFNNSLSPRKSYGKTINLQLLKEIHQKEKSLINAQRHSIFKSCDYSNFNSEHFIKDYIKKCEENSEKKKMLIEEKFSPLITEETFNSFIRHFYERKMLKSSSLMKYFQGKNIEVVLCNSKFFIF